MKGSKKRLTTQRIVGSYFLKNGSDIEKSAHRLEKKIIEMMFEEGETLEEVFAATFIALGCLAKLLEERDAGTTQSAAPSRVKPKVSGVGRKRNSKKPKRAR